MPAIDSILKVLVAKGGSDLHLTSNCKPLIRESGDMMALGEFPIVNPQQMKDILMEIAPKRNWEEFTKTGDADFAYEIQGLARFRVNFFMDNRGMGAVLRVIPSKILTMEDLNLPAVCADFCKLSKGLVVVTGPTGSGKSTTLAAMIDHINKTRKEHVITIEDPIEFVYQNNQCLVNQREVGRHTRGFKVALRAALREDPDIVLIGEMRDLETIEIALETAETGHLVFGTLHTTTASSTIDRIIDQFPADRQAQIRTMLSTSLKGVVAQVLCKKIPKGRVAAHEILVANSAISSFIREGKTHQIPSTIQTGKKLGMKLLNTTLLDLVQNKLVDPLEAYMKSVDKGDLITKFEGIGVKLNIATGDNNSQANAA